MRKSGRKLMSVAVAAAMVLSLAACGGKTADTTTAATTEAATEATTAAESTEAETEAAKAENQQADIVVIGAGGAGMTAAIQAVQDGATDVVVLEKMPITGGNTTRSTGTLRIRASSCSRSRPAAWWSISPDR